MNSRISSFVLAATAAGGVAIGAAAIIGTAVAHVLATGIAGVFGAF